MEIFLDETGECEQMLAEIFRSDTSESHFMQHRIMTSVHYNYSRSNSLLRDNYEYIMYKHARVEAYRNEISSAQRGERALPHALIRRLRIHRARLEAASLADRGPTPEKKRAVQPDSQAA